MSLLGSVLGSVMGGQQANPQAQLINAIVGMIAGGGAQPQGGGGLGGMIGSALGGGQAQGGGGLGGMLGNVVSGALGGGQAQGGGGLGGMLGNMVGGALGGGHAAPAGGGMGGLGGLVEAFTRNGMGDVAKSWVGTGQNLPVSHDQLTQVLGQGQIAQMAQQLGLNQSDLLGQLSHMLPQVVDQLTPQGNIPQGDIGGMGDLGSLLGGLLKR